MSNRSFSGRDNGGFLGHEEKSLHFQDRAPRATPSAAVPTAAEKRREAVRAEILREREIEAAAEHANSTPGKCQCLNCRQFTKNLLRRGHAGYL